MHLQARIVKVMGDNVTGYFQITFLELSEVLLKNFALNFMYAMGLIPILLTVIGNFKNSS